MIAILIIAIPFVVVVVQRTTATAQPTPVPTTPTDTPTVVPAQSPTVQTSQEVITSPITCDGVSLTMSCPSGKKIKYGSIKYGRWDNTICPHSTVNSSTPSRFSQFSIPTNWIGETSVTVNGYVNTLVGENTYPNVYKTYQVELVCDL